MPPVLLADTRNGSYAIHFDLNCSSSETKKIKSDLHDLFDRYFTIPFHSFFSILISESAIVALVSISFSFSQEVICNAI